MTEVEEETIGRRLKRLRLAAGMSQRELAVPGVSYAYISRIEAGTRSPSVKALRRLAAKLDVPTDYLETGVDPHIYLLVHDAELDRSEALCAFRDYSEAVDWAGMLNRCVDGEGDDEDGRPFRVDTVKFDDSAMLAALAEQYGSETVTWRIERPIAAG